MHLGLVVTRMAETALRCLQLVRAVDGLGRVYVC